MSTFGTTLADMSPQTLSSAYHWALDKVRGGHSPAGILLAPELEIARRLADLEPHDLYRMGQRGQRSLPEVGDYPAELVLAAITRQGGSDALLLGLCTDRLEYGVVYPGLPDHGPCALPRVATLRLHLIDSNGKDRPAPSAPEDVRHLCRRHA
ncbi:hypothetical protein O7626_14410 [Micromonospora sp. WMMD1102]|uniref:hypothetical protein n=1 Tax=Micromonospora sp. WMMD1102 TaxID=3016105 RepID=UPI0024150AD8|nr:hypothetical protein [Micromonospora sp. WMMD1102]MDG4787107.1 hypothetical protein [Micromonospora sp. WMMD1102]